MTPSSRQPLVNKIGPPPRDGRFHLAALSSAVFVVGLNAADRQLRDLVHLIAVQSKRRQKVEVALQVNLVRQVGARQ
jgi:hypothetical protein